MVEAQSQKRMWGSGWGTRWADDLIYLLPTSSEATFWGKLTLTVGTQTGGRGRFRASQVSLLGISQLCQTCLVLSPLSSTTQSMPFSISAPSGASAHQPCVPGVSYHYCCACIGSPSCSEIQDCHVVCAQ